MSFVGQVLFYFVTAIGRFVEQKLMLSSSFWCDQIFEHERYDFGHILLCYLSLTSVCWTNARAHAQQALGVKNLRTWESLFWTYFAVLYESDLDVQQTLHRVFLLGDAEAALFKYFNQPQTIVHPWPLQRCRNILSTRRLVYSQKLFQMRKMNFSEH